MRACSVWPRRGGQETMCCQVWMKASKQRINRFIPWVYGLTYPNFLSYNMSIEYHYSRHSHCVLNPRNFSLRCWFTRRPKHLTERGRESNGGLRMVTDVATLVWPRGLQLDCTCKKPSNYGFIGLQRRNIARYHTPAPSSSHISSSEKNSIIFPRDILPRLFRHFRILIKFAPFCKTDVQNYRLYSLYP